MRDFFAFLRKRSTASSDPEPVPASPSRQPETAETPTARWLSKDDPANPFVFDGYDCLAFVQSMRAVTKDPDVAASFVALRAADGRALTGTLPEGAVEASCGLTYAFDGELREGTLHKAAVMEEKWDIYLYGNRVYFSRSWTGALALVAEFTIAGLTLSVLRVWAPASLESSLPIQQVDYLIKSHLYKRHVPHPLPSTLSREAEAVALYSFGQYGRLCCFGTFENTIREHVLKSPQVGHTAG